MTVHCQVPSKMVRILVLLAVGVITSSCVDPNGFQCTRDTDCGSGVCEPIIRLCSFADSSCESGRRFGDFAQDRSNQCVDPDPPCGKMAMLADSFDAAARQPFWSGS